MKSIRYNVLLFFILAVLSCFTSCRSQYNKKNISPTNSPTDITGSSNDLITPTISEHLLKELRIYTINPVDNDVIPVSPMVYNEEITPDLIVDYVIESMEDAYYFIEVVDVITDGDTIIMDFSDETPPCHGVLPDIEIAILDSFAQSLLDNLDNYNKIIYKTMGENYISDNRSYPLDYVYLEIKK